VEGDKEMDPSEQKRSEEVRDTLEAFLKELNEYSAEVFGEHQQERLNTLRSKLQRHEPKVTAILLDILGDGAIKLSYSGIVTHRDLLASALMGGNNEMPIYFKDYETTVTSLVNRALGKIEAGLWPRKKPKPVLVVKDSVLKQRCSDLLEAPGNFDRVIREATTVLEDRIRNKVPHNILATLIPIAKEQTGEKLLNKVFSPDKPVLVVSSEKHERIAFHRMLLGAISYLRNPHHHQLDDTTEWSWAWSTTGLIDRLLADVESCTLSEQPGPQ